MKRTRATLAGVALAVTALGFFASSAAATFEATMVPRGASRKAGPSFVVEAGGGRRTRIREFEFEGGSCGSIYAPLINAGREKPGFATGNGAATFSLNDPGLVLRFELKVGPHGEGLVGRGLLEATVGSCHERVAMDLTSATIRGGGRRTSRFAAG